ncbi:uncharacterized protein LOC131950257 isoform X2 [Physella acuta]|uniref:uncharacterized protein LOC131950257 isoform X2 n=1 Tax=Physella acuta TaxID=109671 RepID=UPI0027DB87CB|nr:uncharacterized protein LOC131950257 isoform X2 [Physella acuta]
MFKLVLVLSLCYIAAVLDCKPVKRSFGCDSALACLGNYRLENSEKLSFEQYCEKARAAVSCYHHVEDQCDDQDLKYNISSQINLDDLICLEDSETLADDSECAKNMEKMGEANEAAAGCVETYLENERQLALTSDTISGHDASAVSVCPLVDQLYRCVLTTGTEICGSAYGSFQSSLFELSYGQFFHGLECRSHARKARRSVELMVPLLSKATKLK